jgi:hypothetical protein
MDEEGLLQRQTKVAILQPVIARLRKMLFLPQ